MTTVLGVLLFIVALMTAIFLHEGGHFATAKLFGMKVERFFLGFGPTLWSFRRGETEYGVKAVPLGGFCKIAGMSPYEDDPNFLERERRRAGTPRPAPTPPDRQFRNKPASQRAIVLAAGSFTHFAAALVLAYVLLVSVGLTTEQPTTRVASVLARTTDGRPTPAGPAGLRAGDRIVAINGHPVATFDQLHQALADQAGKQTTVTYERAGARHTVTLVPARQLDENGQVRGLIGIRPAAETTTERLGPVAGLSASGRLFGRIVVDSVRGLGGLVPGFLHRVSPAPATSGGGGGGGQEGGPVGILGIGRLAGQAIAAGAWDKFLFLLVTFNIFVGIFNLLPLPPLDGGYLAMVGWEALTRRRVDLRRIIPVAAVITGLLLILVVGTFWLDLTSPLPNPFAR